jgi:Zn-dependent protease
MDGLTPEFLRTGLLFYILLFSCLVLRTFAQAWLADRLGDPTPRDEGRVTLYPVPHIDLLGTVILPLICIFVLSAGTGINFFLAWTNPVPINPANFGKPQRDYLFTQLSSCGMSVLLGFGSAIVGALLYRFDPRVQDVVIMMIRINAMLIVLDLLPIPPLPGGLLLKHFGFISEERYWMISRWSGLAFMIAINIPPIAKGLGLLIQLAALPFGIVYSLIVR